MQQQAVQMLTGGSESVYTSTDGLTIPEFYSLGNSINPLRSSNVLRERRTASLYGMLDLETLGFLYLSFTGRYDKTSTLPVRNNAFFYPSAGISAVLSDVLKLPAYLSFLKLRASWAKVNTGTIDRDDPYRHITTYGLGPKWNNIPSLSLALHLHLSGAYTGNSSFRRVWHRCRFLPEQIECGCNLFPE